MKLLLRFLLCTISLVPAQGVTAQTGIGKGITSRTAVVDGTQIQYLTAGHGPAVVLLHGYAETSRM